MLKKLFSTFVGTFVFIVFIGCNDVRPVQPKSAPSTPSTPARFYIKKERVEGLTNPIVIVCDRETDSEYFYEGRGGSIYRQTLFIKIK